MSEKFILAAADYAIFGITLLISAGIGLYFRIFGGEQKTNKEYLLAGRDMPIFPVSFSLMVSFMSAPNLMGIPAEMYLFGTNMTFMNIGFIIGPIISSLVFMPIYFKLGVSTSYEYLERRYGKSTRGILSALFLFLNLFFNGISLYAPALALSAVTNLSLWASLISIGLVSTFYSTLGGMKAVLWTDLFQAILMYACLIAIIVKGCIDLGGLQNIFQSAYEGGRILLPTFKVDFSSRYTMWSILLQGTIIATASYGINQIQVQRCLTLKTLKRSTIAILVSIVLLVVFQLSCCLCGLIFYVHFKTCDPLSSAHSIQMADQLMPYYISSVMREYPILPGLCIAGIFSASLSTISSCVNSMAAVIYEDIIHSLWRNLSRPVLITKIATVFCGIVSILITFLVASLGTLIKASILAVGTVSGTALGVYILAVFTSTTNEMGANLGVLVGFFIGVCLTFIPNNRYYPQLPMGNNCTVPSGNMINFTTQVDYLTSNSTYMPTLAPTTQMLPEDNFPVSFMWITPISLLTCLIFGYFGSWFISLFRGPAKPIPDELLSPVLTWFMKRHSTDQVASPKHEIPLSIALSTESAWKTA